MLDFDPGFTKDVHESARVPFAGSLSVAKFDGETPPDRQAFESVEGFNLSHSGISFATSAWPVTDRLMVALGDERAPVLVSAQVIACTKQVDLEVSAGYEVRCQFDQWHA